MIKPAKCACPKTPIDSCLAAVFKYRIGDYDLLLPQLLRNSHENL